MRTSVQNYGLKKALFYHLVKITHCQLFHHVINVSCIYYKDFLN